MLILSAETIKKRTKDKSGFSFVELMVVIALVGVLSAIAVPSFLRTLPEKRLKNATRNLYADMQKARLLAVKENRTVRVRFTDSTDNKNDFYYFDDNNNGNFDSNELRRDLSEYGDVSYGYGKATKKWDGGPLPASSIHNPTTFTNTGTAKSGSTALQSHDVCYAVTITDYGAVKIRRFNGISWDKK